VLGKLIHRFGLRLQRLAERITRRKGEGEIWIDIGAHNGESSFEYAQQNPSLKVYAVEPNLRSVSKLVGRLPNYFVLPLAIAEQDGSADFYLSAYDQASSLLPFSEDGLRDWDGQDLKTISVSRVPTIRLDTLMELLNVESVDFLKIDTQGMDLAVVRSAGQRLKDIAKIRLEVWVGQAPLYVGAPSESQVVGFLEEAGFTLTHSEEQTGGREHNLTFTRRKSLAPDRAIRNRERDEAPSSVEPART
jgi:FkbM family methyltransferase